MDTKLTIRQIYFLFLFISISSIFNYIPNTAAYYAGGSGFISVIYAGGILLVFSMLVLQIIKCYPNKNFYEIIGHLFGTPVAKVVFFLYGLWAFANLCMKIGAYSVTLQATLMPSIQTGILITVLFLLVIYALTKNNKTIFRVAEFSYQPIFFFLFLLFLFALPSLDYVELIPVTLYDLENNLGALPMICSISGNIFIILFFCGKIAGNQDYSYIRGRTLNTVFVFTMISMLSTIVAIGLNGALTTANLAFPIFQSVKTISILHTFERFDSFITLIGVMSDFVAIMTFLIIFMKCLEWVFGCKKPKIAGAIFLFLATTYLMIRNYTQYEFNQLMTQYLMYINLIFQYLLPACLGLLCLVHTRLTKNQQQVTELK